ncbi:MAG: hypothetical protein FWF47_03040 [Clostridia bacterium]|nr:hypothetical protein [Clostridia bacterium]
MKRPYLIAGALLVLTAVVMLFGFRTPVEPAPAPQDAYLLIVSDDTGAFLLQLKRGMDDAAARLNARWSLKVLAAGEIPDCSDKNGAVIYLDHPEAVLASIGCPAVVIGQTVSSVPCIVSAAPEGDSPVSDTDVPLAELVAMLEAGTIDAFYAADPYAMGYLAVAALKEGGGREVPLKLITRDNLYGKENVKLVFPLLE